MAGLTQFPLALRISKIGWQEGYKAQDVQRFYPSCIVYETKTLTGKPIKYMTYNRDCVNNRCTSDLLNQTKIKDEQISKLS